MSIRGLKGPFALLMLCTLPIVIGCQTLDVMPDGEETPITTVVKDVYAREGQGRMIFLGTEEEEEADLHQTISRLAMDLNTRVRPESEAVVDDSHPILTPIDPETGEVGVRISLGPFTVDEQGHLHVTVAFSRSGLDGAVYEYILKRTSGHWSVREVRQTAIA